MLELRKRKSRLEYKILLSLKKLRLVVTKMSSLCHIKLCVTVNIIKVMKKSQQIIQFQAVIEYPLSPAFYSAINRRMKICSFIIWIKAVGRKRNLCFDHKYFSSRK